MRIEAKPKRDTILYASITKLNKKYLDNYSKKSNRSLSELTNIIIEEHRKNASKKTK